MTKILVCDDNLIQCEKTVRTLGLSDNVDTLSGESLRDSLTCFFSSISDLFNDSSAHFDTADVSKFNGYDVLIVDNNLTELELKGARLTAETIIGYLRAFSDTPYIVSLNKNLHVDFDLRYLFGDFHSLADVALNTEHLSNSCLWESSNPSGFAPWYWPRLSSAPDQRRRQQEFLRSRLHCSVWENLDFPEVAAEFLTLRAKSALLATPEQSFRDTPFQAFFDHSRSLAHAEKVTLKANTEIETVQKAIVQITAYEVDRWIRRDVLGPQDVLIDLPHLITQFPILLGDGSVDLNRWNQVVSNRNVPFGLEDELFRDYVEAHQFSEDLWAPKPCFWWPPLADNQELSDRFFNAEETWPEAVFCEDSSRFLEIGVGEGLTNPKEFETEIEGSWGRRYIEYVGEFSYSPRNRILTEVD